MTRPDVRRAWPNAVAWGLLLLAALFALRQVISSWRLGASRDLGENGDISVYIGAINYLSSGGELYDYPLEGGYGFTYPPFAAIVLRPLTWPAPLTTGLLWLSLCVLVALVVVALVVATRPLPTGAKGRLVVAALAAGAFLGTSQVQSDLITGQVNLVLALMVVLDVGRIVPDRARGALVGLAAAIKLTPMIVWGWFLLTRQWRALATSVGTFGVCVALAWVVMPGDSRRFWAEAVLDTGRVGDTELRFNSTVMGTLARADVDGSARTVLWLAIGGTIVLAAYWNAQRARRADDHVAAAVLLGCAAVIATPLAWPHHQIWLPLAGIVLVCRPAWAPRLSGLAVVAFAYFHIPLTRWWDDHELGWFFDNLDFAMLVGVCVLGLAAGRPADEVRPAGLAQLAPRSPSGRRSPSAP